LTTFVAKPYDKNGTSFMHGPYAGRA